MEIKFLGHAGVQVKGEKNILIDPFLTHNLLAVDKADKLVADYILLTHAHDDHLADAVQIAKNNGSTIVANNDLAIYLSDFGVKTHSMNIGGTHTFADGFKVKMTTALHTSCLEDGRSLGVATGFLFWLCGKCFYHAGDTGLFGDMATVIGLEDIEVAFLPIGDNFTMGPKDALLATTWLNPQYVVPIHYNTFPVIQQNAKLFKTKVEAQTQSKCVVLAPGEKYIL